MNTSEIARKILEVRKRPSPFIMNGELMLLLGPDGFQEALSRRWLIQDSENGAMLVTPLEAFISQMRQLAEEADTDYDPEVGDSVVVASDGATYTATVQSKAGDDYKLSFPPGKGPNRVVPSYKKGELKKFAQPEQKIQPGSVPVKQKAPSQSVPYNPGPGLNQTLRQVPQ
jgi:hypothetical protein